MTLSESCVVEPLCWLLLPSLGEINKDVKVEDFCSLHPITKSLTSLQLLQLQNPARANRRASLGFSRCKKLTNLMRVHTSTCLFFFSLSLPAALSPSPPKEFSPVTRCSTGCFQNGGSGSAAIPQAAQMRCKVLSCGHKKKKKKRYRGRCMCVCVFPPFYFLSFL